MKRKVYILLAGLLFIVIGLPGSPAVGSPPQCDDGIDNDGDGGIDYAGYEDAASGALYGADPNCDDQFDTSEWPECNDGIDNDGDGGIDYAGYEDAASGALYGADPNCDDQFDFYERPVLLAVGDALAAGHGLGIASLDDPDAAYPAVLAAEMGFRVINWASSGTCAATNGESPAHPQTPSDWGGREKCGSSVLSQQLDEAVSPSDTGGRPTVVTLSIGVEDILLTECIASWLLATADPCSEPYMTSHLTAFESNLTSVVRRARLLQSDRILVNRVYNPFPGPPGSDEEPCSMFEYASMVIRERKAHPIRLVSPRFLQAEVFLKSQVAIARLNSVIQKVADEQGALTVNLDTQFNGRDMCRQYGAGVSVRWLFGPSGTLTVRREDSERRFDLIPSDVCSDPCRQVAAYQGSGSRADLLAQREVSYDFVLSLDGAPYPTRRGHAQIARIVQEFLDSIPIED